MKVFFTMGKWTKDILLLKDAEAQHFALINKNIIHIKNLVALS